jgi:hypothetical protein
MRLFPLANRKNIVVSLTGADFTLYEPSALDRCEYLRLGSSMLAQQKTLPEISETPSQQETGLYHEAIWLVSGLNRKQTAFLVAACLKPGVDMAFSDILAEVESQPDDTLNALSDAAFELSGINTPKKD